MVFQDVVVCGEINLYCVYCQNWSNAFAISQIYWFALTPCYSHSSIYDEEVTTGIARDLASSVMSLLPIRANSMTCNLREQCGRILSSTQYQASHPILSPKWRLCPHIWPHGLSCLCHLASTGALAATLCFHLGVHVGFGRCERHWAAAIMLVALPDTPATRQQGQLSMLCVDFKNCLY